MCLKLELYLIVLLALVWILDQSNCEKDFNTCSFYYWKVDWDSAVKTCEKNSKQLLCYKSKKEIDDITEAFRLSAYGDAELELWLSSENCSLHYEKERCLSLHIEKSKKGVWHYFQRNCRNRFPFVCCIKEGIMSSTTHTVSEWSSSTISYKILSSTATVQTSSPVSHCKGLKRRGILWPDTELGDFAVLPCPGKSTGKAKWLCDELNNGKWSDNGPDFKQCRSLDIQNIKEKFNTSSAVETVSMIGNAFEDQQKEMFGEDLVDIISMMKVLPDKFFHELQKELDSVRWTTTVDIVEQSMSIIDRMIVLPDSWKDISEKRRPLIGSDFLSTVDNFGALLADEMPESQEEESVIRKNMALQVIQTEYGEPIELPQSTIASHYNHIGNIVLEKGYDKQLDPQKGNISVVFTLYSNLSNVLEAQLSSKKSLILSTLNSAVLSATVTQMKKVVPVSSKARILIEHLIPNPNNTACVFWSMKENQWDTKGCNLEQKNTSYSLCVCNHLTNFAVLMDYKGILDEVDDRPFYYITVIGCTLSIISLAFCVMIFSCYSYHTKHSWGLRYIIHRNLCLTLLIANMVLVLGLDKTDNQRICAAVAGMLHYFFLSAFSWMLLEGVHIYMLLVVVFASRRSHWEKYYFFGYGFPLVIVAVTAIARPMYYGTDEVCWLSVEKGTIWAFMGPVACILFVNIAALILAQYKASSISVKNDNIALVKRWLRITFILFPVLGITWLLGFLFVGKRFLVAGYLFAIFNSLQGFCIFVCHCLLDKKARNMVLASFKKKSASVNTGSTAMQKNKKDTRESDLRVLEMVVNGKTDEIDDGKYLPQLHSENSWKAWRKWRMPWSFCFDMPVSEKGASENQKRTEDPPKPLIIQWNNLNEKT